MTHSRYRVVTLALFALTACGGGQMLAPAVPKNPTALTPAASKAGAVALTITVPQATAQGASRRPAYVSPATGSVSVTPQGAPTQTFALAQSSPGCSNAHGPLSCSFNVSAPVAQNEALAISTFASADGSGAPLSLATLLVNVVAGQSNPVNVTLNGVVASLSVALDPANVPAGTAATVQVIVNARDAAGSTIVGPGVYADAAGKPVTIGLSDADSSKSTTLSQSSTTTPTPGITLTYDGNSSFSGQR